jgi:hypothetical protein
VKIWAQRIAVTLVAAFIALYGGDWAIYKLRGSPQSKVTIQRYITVPLKGNKQEYDYIGSMDVPCSQSLFPQSGENPCWQVRRNTSQNTTM